MRNIYSNLIAMVAVVLFAPLVFAAGTKPTFPSWSQRINTTKRFTVLTAFGSAAVLDNKTGLVWEQNPSTSTSTWSGAQSQCNVSTVGGRLGWWIPTIQELASLVDPDNSSGNPDLPPGHPFNNVQTSNTYWSATTLAGDTSKVWSVGFAAGSLFNDDKSDGSLFVWCVRGGQGVDPQ